MHTWDYIIVGAGSAGCALANRLSADPKVSVLLLEAGPADTKLEIGIPAAFSKLFRSRLDWSYDTVPQPGLADRTIYWPRGKVLGGSSSINAMMWVRGYAADYDRWAELSSADWGYRELLPYFHRIEDVADTSDPDHGTGGILRIERQRSPRSHTSQFEAALAEVGLSMEEPNSAQPEGFSQTRVNQKRGRRFSGADGYLKPIRGRKNLTVLTAAHATRVLFDGGGGAVKATATAGEDAPTAANRGDSNSGHAAHRGDANANPAAHTSFEPPASAAAAPIATGVEFVRNGVRHTAHACREVVLSGGAVNTPQLLMLSGIGDAAELRRHRIEVVADRPEVGQNLQDHLVSGLIVEAQGDTLFSAEKPKELAKYLLRRRGMLTSNVAEAYGFLRSRKDLELPDLEFIFSPVAFVGEGLQPAPRHGITLGVLLEQPASRGSVTLASADPFDHPLIDPRYLSDPAGIDRKAMLTGLALADRVLHSAAFSDTVGDYIAPEGGAGLSDEERYIAALENYAHTMYHPVGTCRMGSDAASVVDPQLRVRGVQRLRVADASIMPTIIRGHTHAPAVVIGEKAADLLLAP